ncbi:MAG: glycosyltransferase family 1 protein, partial [Anaerolineae bacterium]|nr:glycosyltransferase family 1 protein [Anaerolineae bacterium]
GREGYLVAPEDAGAVAAILRRLSSDRAQLAAMGQAALERFATLPTWEESMAQARGFLNSIIGSIR